MNAEAGERAVRSHAFFVDLPLARALVLFEPEGERRWAHGWDPAYVHPSDGRTEPGMVFTTAHGPAPAVWVVSRYEPGAGLIEYVAVAPGFRATTVLVQCARVSAGRTRVTVVYTLTGLDERGNAFVRHMTQENYARMIDGWESAIRGSVAAAAGTG